MNLNISQLLMLVTQRRPFYGALASSLQLVESPGMGTMAVGIRNGRNTLFYDKEFMKSAPLGAIMFVLEHELTHLIFLHIPRLFELLALCPKVEDRPKLFKVANIAMDAAVNNSLRRHEAFEETRDWSLARVRAMKPEGTPDDPKDGMILPENWGLPMDGTYEQYQLLLMQQNPEEMPEPGEGGSDHKPWLDSDGQQGSGPEGRPGSQRGKGGGSGDPVKDLLEKLSKMSADELLSEAHRLREQSKQALRAAVRAAGGTGRGTMPSDVAEFLQDLLQDPVIPWWEIFTTRARASRLAKARRSIAVPNRMLLALAEEDARIIPTPGRVKDKSWRIFMYVDTSGSMSTESLQIAKSELQHMLAVDQDMQIRYMQGDAATHVDVVLNHGEEIPSEVVGRGGTDFDEYFKHMRQYVDDPGTAPDLVIVYTDGFAPAVAVDNRLPSEVPVIWLVTPHHANNFNEGYGEILVCDPSQNGEYKN